MEDLELTLTVKRAEKCVASKKQEYGSGLRMWDVVYIATEATAMLKAVQGEAATLAMLRREAVTYDLHVLEAKHTEDEWAATKRMAAAREMLRDLIIDTSAALECKRAPAVQLHQCAHVIAAAAAIFIGSMPAAGPFMFQRAADLLPAVQFLGVKDEPDMVALFHHARALAVSARLERNLNGDMLAVDAPVPAGPEDVVTVRLEGSYDGMAMMEFPCSEGSAGPHDSWLAKNRCVIDLSK